MNFESIADTIIKKTLSKGATDCDVVLARGSGKSISCRLQKIEDIEESNDKTFGIRALIGNRQAFVSSSDIEEDKPCIYLEIPLHLLIIYSFPQRNL